MMQRKILVIGLLAVGMGWHGVMGNEGPIGGAEITVQEGLPGKQMELIWPTQAGLRYRIEKADTLTPDNGGWKAVHMVGPPWPSTATGSTRWRDTEPLAGQQFYRISQPVAEIFHIEAPVLSPDGGELVLHGQCIPDGTSLELELSGGGFLLVPLVEIAAGIWQAQIPSGATLKTGDELAAYLVDAGGVRLLKLGQQITVTASGRALDGPAMLPPAAPVPPVAPLPNENWRTRGIHFDEIKLSPRRPARNADLLPEDDFPDFGDPELGTAMAINRKALPGEHLRPVAIKSKACNCERNRSMPAPAALPGEVSFLACDLEMMNASGPPLAWVRTYRSKAPVESGHGVGWDFSYNIRMEVLSYELGAENTINRIAVYDGGGRRDVYHRDDSGTFVCMGLFREGEFIGDTFFLRFADGGVWSFRALDGSTAAGKIDQVTDRNGVSLSCDYDESGRLSRVRDTTGNFLFVTWGEGERIMQVRDSANRFVNYNYHNGLTTSGSAGDLHAVSVPTQTGLPPVAGPTTYTYSSGFADARLNHNLLSVRDGMERLLEAFTYSATTDPQSVAYDTCASHDGGGSAGGLAMATVLHFAENTGEAAFGPAGSYTVYHNDELGRVSEIVVDRQHRPIRLREYTGFAVPGFPVTHDQNRPQGKLRDDDPEFFESIFEYNADHALTRWVLPDGSALESTFEGDLNPTARARVRGNVRSISLLSFDRALRTVRFEYPEGFGSGEPTARPGNPINGQLCKGGRYHDIDSDEIDFSMHAGGNDQPEERSINGVTLNTSHLDYSTARGNRVPTASPCPTAANAGAAAFMTRLLDYAESGDPMRFVSRMISAHGQVWTWTYDERGNCTAHTTPIPGAGAFASYNDLGQCTSITLLNGNAEPLVSAFEYDPTTALLVAEIRDSNIGGLQLTTRYEYDAIGRVVQHTDPRGHAWDYAYNPLNQLVRIESPVVGTDELHAARIRKFFSYDAGSLIARIDTEHRMASGELHSTNPLYSTFHVYDTSARLILIAHENRPVDAGDLLSPLTLGSGNFDVVEIDYNAAGQVASLTKPAASRGQAQDQVIEFTYDERGRHYRIHQGGADAPERVTSQFDYDAFGALIRVHRMDDTLSNPATDFSYDSLHRLTAVTDPMGNVLSYAYDNNGNLTMEFHGEQEDHEGSDANVLLARGRRVIKAAVADDRSDANVLLARDLIGTIDIVILVPKRAAAFHAVVSQESVIIQDRFVAGVSGTSTETTVIQYSPAGLPQRVMRNGETVLTVAYDVLGRPLSYSDGASSFALGYDAAGDVVAITRYDLPSTADGVAASFSRNFERDALGRITLEVDGVGNASSMQWDSLNRCVMVVDASGQITVIDYDGMEGDRPFSRRVAVEIDNSGVATTLSTELHRCGELITTTNSHGFATIRSLDALGRLARIDFADGTSETMSYNPLGLPAQWRRQDGSVSQFGYDRNGRRISETWQSGSEAVAAHADSTWVFDGLGRVRRLEQAGHSMEYQHDSLGNTVFESQGGYAIERSFNHRGRTGITYPDGRRFSETRSANGLLLAIHPVTGGGGLQSPVVTFEYTGRRPARTVHANGVITTYSSRGDGALDASPDFGGFGFDAITAVRVETAAAELAHIHLARDPMQRLIAKEEFYGPIDASGKRSATFTRDAIGHVQGMLVQRTAGGGLPPVIETDVSYVLDTEGRRLSASGGNNPGEYLQLSSIPPADQQMGQYSAWPQGPIEWDNAGRSVFVSTASGPLIHTYDTLGNRLAVIDANSGSLLASFTYDRHGRRITRTDFTAGLDPVVTRFIYDGATCIQEFGDDDIADLSFVAAGGIHHCISTRNGTLYYPHGTLPPASGSASAERMHAASTGPYLLADASGNVLERYSSNEDSAPVFLSPGGEPLPANASAHGLRWLQAGFAWEPVNASLVAHAGIVDTSPLSSFFIGNPDSVAGSLIPNRGDPVPSLSKPIYWKLEIKLFGWRLTIKGKTK